MNNVEATPAAGKLCGPLCEVFFGPVSVMAKIDAAFPQCPACEGHGRVKDPSAPLGYGLGCASCGGSGWRGGVNPFASKR